MFPLFRSFLYFVLMLGLCVHRLDIVSMVMLCSNLCVYVLMCFLPCFMLRSTSVHVYTLESMFYHVYVLDFTYSHTCFHAYV